ncbi:MAG: metal-dependent transcriptional regulator [SAR202 cluster bacterium]|jgi:DtxR family Mn-dependent transcriptional regulator|nr:hypothetical protein [Chloroflexota bacterium]MDP6420972.1 metal-dependent transcriptional regulator [SAR202 cluster bacterium]HAL49232.1 hypothetical protein [Dehalococcoidia bacterium]MDP6665090.1 metal-dependent transcriptional regulator [SAR202 cluster bacterium]MDP6799924.1 metal-dependent transcriptional regulator [SAR202 cluster bacterium]|tara:strand:+ start:329 stop:1054 length:726 start_codon:yes stop_codon:yes gene_type:complete
MTSSRTNNTENDPSARLSRGAENYLLSIFRLAEQDRRVTATVLAEQLKLVPEDERVGTSLPSVGGMIRRMVREGLVETTKDKEVLLTPSGRRSAEIMVRRHRLAERLVVDLLGLELHLAHIEAHRLEHAISAALEAKIVAALSNPTTCPFGHPIPGSGHTRDRRSVTLDHAPSDAAFVIDTIPEDNQTLLRYMVENGLIPGRSIIIVEAAIARGVVTLECEGNPVVFSYDVASKIWASPKT